MTEEKSLIQSNEQTTADESRPNFVSLRWRALFPVSLVVTLVAMAGAYFVASNLGGGIDAYEQNLVLHSSVTTAEQTVVRYDHQRAEAQRVAYTTGVPEAIRAGQEESLHPLLESIALAANLDSVIVTDRNGVEVIGLLLTRTSEFTDYAVSTGTDLSTQRLVRDVLDSDVVGATALFRTPSGLVLYTAVPIIFEQELFGVALVGERLEQVLEATRASRVAESALYSVDGALLQSTMSFPDDVPGVLNLDGAIINQALTTVQQVVTAETPLILDGEPYRVAYAPFIFGPNTLGVLSTLVPDSVPFATEIGRQATALLVAALTGAVVMSVFIVVSRMTGRVEQVTAVAEELSAGVEYSRTGMTATDEIGAMGQALDQYADVVQDRQDKLRDMLRRQRRESNYLIAVLESMPDGIIVQDLDGRVILMNDHARRLLGSQRVFRSSGMYELTAVVTDMLGPALVPGIYALGDPRRIDLDGRMLSAQAAAIMSMSNERLGTVIVLRDITKHVREEQSREKLISQLAQDIQQPLAGLAQTGAQSPNNLVNAFAREISRYSASLQKMVVEMRELSRYDQKQTAQVQRPLQLDALIWAVANDWRQIAQAANLSMHVIIEEKGLYVLGDEARLRWALGNVVDNAIKYTPPGGAMTLEIKGDVEGMIHMRVRDNGVGISKDDLDEVFTRFYRGTPVTEDGRVLRVPGMGQGLTVARQILDAHGGKIRVKSKQHVGTAVYIGLPSTAPMGYQLPYLDEAIMEGETVPLPANIDIDAFWSGLEPSELE